MKSAITFSGLILLTYFAMATTIGVVAVQAAPVYTGVMMPPPTPIVVPGTPTCADLNASSNPAFSHIVEGWGLRVNRSGATPYDQVFPFVNGPDTQLEGGAGPSPNRSVRVAAGGNTMSWSSNRLITAVIVQGGPLGAFVYPYNPASFGGFPNGDGSGLMTAAGCATIDYVTFCFQTLEPTSAPASVSGRVVTSMGGGISGARLTIMNAQTGVTWVGTTNSLGYFAIEGLPVGNFYVLTVSHARYSFSNDTRSFTLNEDLSGADFTAN